MHTNEESAGFPFACFLREDRLSMKINSAILCIPFACFHEKFKEEERKKKKLEVSNGIELRTEE